VRVHLSRLRTRLGGDVLVLDSSGYRLDADQYGLDVREFEDLVARARVEPADSPRLLRQALDLLRGEPLSDIEGEGLVSRWRRELAEQIVHAVIARIDADPDAGQAGELVGELERLVSEHPFEERLWGQLMLASYRAGRQADALDVYRRARHLLTG
jgi:DNA-binding SARP family transcriptional activator